ncbi:MAG: glycosyltransferase family 39 protein [Bacteroidales bacterium]|nr:glycosyltransferase family 39 protein [Bacteroidales bacterium]
MKYNKETLIILSILIIAFALRMISVNFKSKNWDEFMITYTSSNCQIPFNTPSVFDNKSYVNNSVKNVISNNMRCESGNCLLYNIVLYYWSCVFGSSDIATRLFSVICGTLIVLFTFLLARKLFNINVAYISSVIAIVHPSLIQYSLLTRTYGFATLLSLVSSFYFVKIIYEKNKKINYYLYVISSIALLFAHYSAFYIILVQALFAGLYLRDKTIWKNLLICGMIVITVFLTWYFIYGYKGFQTMALMNDRWLKEARELDLWTKVVSFKIMILYTYQLYTYLIGDYLHWYMIDWGFRMRYLALILLIPMAFIFLALRNGKTFEMKKIFLILFLGFSCFLLANILAVNSGHTLSYSFQYSQFSVPFIIIILSIGIYKIFSVRNILRYFLFVLLMVYFSVMVIYDFNIYFVSKNKFFSVIAGKIDNVYEKNDTVCYYYYTDAQQTNFHLKSDKTIIQKVDTSININKVILRNRKSNREIEIFEFKGGIIDRPLIKILKKKLK